MAKLVQHHILRDASTGELHNIRVIADSHGLVIETDSADESIVLDISEGKMTAYVTDEHGDVPDRCTRVRLLLVSAFTSSKVVSAYSNVADALSINSSERKLMVRAIDLDDRIYSDDPYEIRDAIASGLDAAGVMFSYDNVTAIVIKSLKDH